MTDSLAATISLNVNALLSGSPDLGTARHSLNETFSNTFTNGTAINQANQMFSDSRTVSASTDDELDLAGVLVNALGTTITFTSVKAIIIKAAAANGANLSVGGDSVAPVDNIFADTSDKILVPPGGMFMITNPQATGFAVTGTTADILEISNLDGAASASYDIIIIGEV